MATSNTHLSKIVLALKSTLTMEAFAEQINERAGSQITSAPTLYGYTTRPRRPEPRQLGQLARYMASNAHERAEILAAYLEDTLDATDIPPSERGIQIVLAVAEALAEDPTAYNAGHDRPDRERDLAKLADYWYRDPDLRQLLHSLAKIIDDDNPTV